MIADWLRKLTSGPPSLSQSTADLERRLDHLSAAERDAIVASHLNEPLAALGLVQAAPRLWVDGSAPPARRVFEMVLLKGASIKANWGFSLDFVPHVSGRRLSWHRSDRTARLDVGVDLRKLAHPCFLWGAERFQRDLAALVPVAITEAQKSWQRGSTWSGMLGLAREIREPMSIYFSPDIFWRPSLGPTFLLAKTGDLPTALAELETYARRNDIAEDIKVKLAKLLQNIASE